MIAIANQPTNDIGIVIFVRHINMVEIQPLPNYLLLRTPVECIGSKNSKQNLLIKIIDQTIFTQ